MANNFNLQIIHELIEEADWGRGKEIGQIPAFCYF
jgi:hypothetical protein